jgi:signal transduction histidine kinase/CheY-like chemotaxis protein
MEIFVADNEIGRLDAMCATVRDGSGLEDLVALCWHLRQRDTQRALALADQADALLASAAPHDAEAKRMGARLQLVRAEARFLFLDREAASASAHAALASFLSLNDHAGCADVHRLLALIADERGDFAGREASLNESKDHALRAGDVLRTKTAEAVIAFFAISRNPKSEADWHDRIDAIVEGGHPAVLAWVSAIRGTVAILSGDFGRAISCGILAYECAVQTGQIRFAIKIAIKVGFAFSKLDDHQAGLHWMQRGLALARPTHWPESVGLCYCHTIGALRQLGLAEAAQELVDEVLGGVAPPSDAYSHSRILQHHGQMAHERGDFRLALTTFTRLEQRADRLSQRQFQIESRRGQARALSGLALSMEASSAAFTTLALAQMQGDRRREIAALQLLAEIHVRHVLPAPEGLNAPSAPLFFLTKALILAESVDQSSIPAELLDAMAVEYAKVGDYSQAYSISQRCIALRDARQKEASGMHSLALEARAQAERAIANEEHLRQQQAAAAELGDQTQLSRPYEERQDVLAHFLAAANHRLRQPIHAMNLCLGALALHNLPPKARPLLDNLRQCAHELGESFLSLLDLSRLQSNMVQPHCEPFPIMSILSRIKCEYLSLAGAKGLDFYVIPSNAWVESDALLVEQILRNFIAHALRFTRNGKIRIGCRRKGHVLRLAVYDTGIGMTPDPKEVLLEDSGEYDAESDELGMGMGMGMAIAKRLARLLSLPIEVKSAHGKGAMFAIDLPLAEPRPVDIAGHAKDAEKLDSLPEKFIVVVDDDLPVLNAMRLLLERWRCTVVTAASRKDVVAKLGASARIPDVLICDFRLHGEETGLQVIEALRVEFNQEIPALLVTGEPVTEGLQSLVPQGIPLLQKPIGPETLRVVLEQLLLARKKVAL